MEYFAEIDIPLTKPERQALARMECRRRAGQEVSPFPGYDRYSHLRARHSRPVQLRRYSAELEGMTFGRIETNDGGATWRPATFLQKFNLFAKQQAYEELKANWQRAGLLDYSREARRHLAQQDKQEAARIEQVSDLAQHNGDPAKAAIAQGITCRLYAAYREYLTADLDHLAATQVTAADGQKALPLPVLALLLIYEGRTLSRGAQANQLAKSAGHHSGDSLYNHYCKYTTQANRLGFGSDTAQKGRNMMSRIQATLPHLSEAAKKRAENELATIAANIS